MALPTAGGEGHRPPCFGAGNFGSWTARPSAFAATLPQRSWRGFAFSDAWPLALEVAERELPYSLELRDWREALSATEAAWQRAYDGQQATRGEVAAARLGEGEPFPTAHAEAGLSAALNEVERVRNPLDIGAAVATPPHARRRRAEAVRTGR